MWKESVLKNINLHCIAQSAAEIEPRYEGLVFVTITQSLDLPNVLQLLPNHCTFKSSMANYIES